MATDKQLRFIALCLIDADLSGFDHLLYMENGAIRTYGRGRDLFLVSKEGGSLLVDTDDNYVMNAYWYGCDDSTRPILLPLGDELAKEAGTDKFTIHLSSDDLAKIEMLIDCYEL